MTEPAGVGDWSIDDFLSDFRAPSKTVHLTARGDLLARHSDLTVRLEGAEALAGDGIDDAGAGDIRDELAQVETELRGSLRKFIVTAVGDRKWSDLIAAHPPTDDDKERHRLMPWHPDTFWPAALAASISEPPVTVDVAQKMLTSIDSGQMQKLRDAVVEVNGGGADIPKSVRSSGRRRSSPPSSDTASL